MRRQGLREVKSLAQDTKVPEVLKSEAPAPPGQGYSPYLARGSQEESFGLWVVLLWGPINAEPRQLAMNPPFKSPLLCQGSLTRLVQLEQPPGKELRVVHSSFTALVKFQSKS